VVKNISVQCVALGGFFFNIGIFIIYLHFPQYAMNNGSSESEVSLYLSIAGICSCIGRILLGMASNSDNVDEDIVYFGSYVVLGILKTFPNVMVLKLHRTRRLEMTSQP
jgi:predicted MFS family arabinose efflux permease